MQKDLELMLEQLYFKTDGIIGGKLLDQIILEAFNKGSLEESSGILGRAPGSIYNKANDQFEVINTGILPETGGFFTDTAELKDAIDDKMKQYSVKKIDKEVGDSTTSKSAIYAFLKNVATQEIVAIIKYTAKSVSSTSKWTDGEIAQETGFTRGKKSGTASSSQVNKMLVKPDDLVADNNPRDVNTLKKHVLKKAFALRRRRIPEFPQDTYKHLQDIFAAAIPDSEESPELENAAPYRQAYNLFLAEILAPISVVQNWNCSGAREAAREAILGGTKDFAQAKIKFNVGQTQPLFDSTLVHPSGKEIFISSKGGSGAPASVVSLLTNIDDLIRPAEGMTKKMKEKNQALHDNFTQNFGKFYNLIKVIEDEGMWTGPIAIASQYAMLTEEEEKCFREMERYQGLNSAAFNKETVNTEQELTKNPAKLYIPPSMQKYLNAFNPKDADAGNYKPALHYISGLAALVVAQLNSDAELNFDGAAKAALNSCLIQVNSKIKKVGNNCQFEKFVVTYPPKFSGKIIADSIKNYSATKLRGKICFKIPVT